MNNKNTYLTNRNLSLLYNFIKELSYEFGNKIKLKHYIFLDIDENNVLRIHFGIELKRKKYYTYFAFNENELIKHFIENDNYVEYMIDIAIKQLQLRIKQNE